MKKHAIILLLLVLSFDSSAQVWVEDNAIWHYDFHNLDASVGFYKLEYVGNEMMGGVLAEKINVSRTHFNYFTGNPNANDTLIFNGVNDFGDYYVYHSGDSVFHWENGQYQLLFDFGVQIGDEWLISVDSTSFDPVCGDSSFVKVVGTGVESFGGVNYRYLDLETIVGSPKYLFGRFSERFGGTGYFLPRTQECGGFIAEWDIINFKCFEDDGLTYNPNSGDCEYYLTQLELGVYDLDLFKLQINPNPATDEIQFSGIEAESIEILDSSGEIYLSEKVGADQKINVSNLPSGFYFINCQLINGHSTTKKLIKK